MKTEYDELYYTTRYTSPLFVKLGLNNLYYLWTAYFCIIRPAGLKKGDKVLDLGCGIGNLVWALRKYGIQSFGIEPSRAAKPFCRIPRYCKYQNTTDLPYKARSFDLVVTNEVLEHIPEILLKRFLKEVHRVTKHQSIHMVCVKDRGNIIYSDPTHAVIKNEEWWINYLKKIGYDVRAGNIFYFFPNIFAIFNGSLKLQGLQKGYFRLFAKE